MSNQIDLERLPQHIAVIMDGNGRWAKEKNLSRTQGHIAGVKRVEEIIDYANEIGIAYMTLYTFSTENWSRPENEVAMLFNTITAVLNQKINKLKKLNMRFRMFGRRDDIPQSTLDAIDTVMDQTKDNTGLTINLAFNYGSRLEIMDAFKNIFQKVQDGQMALDDITEDMVSEHLYTKGIPDPDFLIRTSGEKRISNYLLWQLSYSEFYFTETFWPDFDIEQFNQAICDFQNRDRRFGNLSSA